MTLVRSGSLPRVVALLASLAVAAGIGLASTAHADWGLLPDEAAINQVVGAQAGWWAGADGHGVDVALVDTGVTPVAGLNATNKLVYGPDLSFDSQDPNAAHLDGYGHGTAMAGIIAGNDAGPGGYNGVAPDARLVSVKVGASTGAADVSQIVAGIDWVTQHAHDSGFNIRVLNLSLGTDSVQPYQLDPLAHAAEVAWRHGIVVVVSAGNDAASSNVLGDPADDPYVLSVGAADPRGTISTSDDVIAPFSAPGTAARRPDVVAPGVGVYGLLSPGSTLARQFPNAIFGGRFLRGSGTSQAAAVTSGVVADLLSARPNLTPDQVKAILVSTAKHIGAPTWSSLSVTPGLVQLVPALLSAPMRYAVQSFPPSTGTGSLESARGDNHVALNGVSLTGEQDIFGQPWPSATIAAAEESVTAWNGGAFNGSTWSGSTWSGSTWSGSTWSGSTWSGSTWSGSTWSGSTWSGSTWSGSTWSGSTWSGTTWSSAVWMGATWD